LVYTFTCYTS